ncbi:unnamed protein product [Rhodiola kirilowii]
MVRSSTKVVITKKDQIIMDREATDLSGVYMRSLVKKMSSSSKVRNQDAANGFCQGGIHVKGGQGSSEVLNPQNQHTSPLLQQQQHKKKVRRRLHTSRPYQERLLNMAEARREIVTALKFHRASMKQKQQEPLQQPHLQILSHASPDLEAKVEMINSSSKRSVIYPSDGFIASVAEFHQSPSFTYDSSNHMFYSNVTVPSVSACDNSSFSFSLPSQTLGLNLNFGDLSNLSTSPFQNNPSLFTSPSSSSSSPALSSTTTTTTTEEIHSAPEDWHNGAGGILPYPEMDSEVMKEIKSMGDCYDMVWNDTMHSLTSAWWHKFSTATETSPQELKQVGDDHLFTQLTELPSWLNPTDSYLQPHLNIANSSPDPALPCMDIGEIEGIDGDWFA